MESGNLHPLWVVTVDVLRVGLAGGRTCAQDLEEEAFHRNRHPASPCLGDLSCPEGHGRGVSGGRRAPLGPLGDIL